MMTGITFVVPDSGDSSDTFGTALLSIANCHPLSNFPLPADFSVDASVRIEADDRAGLERLLRCCAHPPFALERLEAIDAEN